MTFDDDKRRFKRLDDERGRRDHDAMIADDYDPVVGRTQKKSGGAMGGVYRVTWNDWIIQGVAGELYPCKPDIFASTYEVVED